MKKHQKEELMNRRDFHRQSACASLGVTGLVNALAQTRLMAAAASLDASATGYKALVCLFLNGGNDSNNLLIPIGDPASDGLRLDYQTGRGVLALDRMAAHAINLPATSKAFNLRHGGAISPLGFHPSAPELAGLFNTGELAVVCNVGSLAYPVATRDDYLNNRVPLPRQLFSHSDQQTQWQSTLPDKPFTSGWGGRAADLLNASYNSTDAKVSMSISLAGINSFQTGTAGNIVQYVLKPTGLVSLTGFGSAADPYGSALNPDGTFKSTPQGARLKAFEQIMQLTHSNLHEEEYNRIIRRARATEGTVGAALAAADASGVDFNGIFTTAQANNPLGDQLKMIARLIAARETLGNSRQIFFCQVTGYDTHAGMLTAHADLMRELSTGLKAFRNALTTMNVFDQVTTFTASDFNRTFTPNSTDSTKAGSDHAWGSHALVMGGAVHGGNLYGHFPSFKIGNAESSIDAGTNLRGRWIPDVAVDQYAARLTRWLGAGASELETIFPNLPRFDDPFASSSPNLDFLPVS